MEPVTVVAVALAAVFVVSAGGKALRHRLFQRALVTTYHLPPDLAPSVAWGVLIAESACAGLLVLPAARLYGLIVSSALLTGFSGAQAVAWSLGWRGECGCLGIVREEALGPGTLFRAVGLAMASWLALLLVLAT